MENYVVVRGFIADTGRASITDYGFILSTDTTNLISTQPSSSPKIIKKSLGARIGGGGFTAKITGLTRGTSYSIAAFATNSAGTGYSTDSLVNKIFNFENVTVENEYVLPHTTVARVKFGEFSSTIITHALPISKFKTKLFVKAYRSYWCYNLKGQEKGVNYHLNRLINHLGDKVTENTMYNTLKQDKSIVDNIDKSSYIDMHGKFSIVYDMFSNHYKNNYKKFYEEGQFDL